MSAKEKPGELTSRTKAAYATVRAEIEKTSAKLDQRLEKMRAKLERRREPRADLDIPASHMVPR